MNEQQREKNGFSLITIIIILALVALLVSISLPRLSFIHHYMLRSELEKMRMIIMYTHQKAIAGNRQQIITLDSTHHAYNITDSNEPLSSWVQFGFLPHSYGPPSNPTMPLKTAITFVNNKIICYPDGTISAGSMYLVDCNKKYMYVLTCPVDDINYLRIYKYDQRWVPIS